MIPATLLDLAVDHTETHIRVDVSHWGEAARCANESGFTYFCFLSAIDWLPNAALDGEHHYDLDRAAAEPPEVVIDPAIRVAGGSSRFALLARLQNVDTHHQLFLTADLNDDMCAPTWTHVYRGADWHERETWEMFGIDFDGHPGLRHIYLPDEFVGHPLRKDFALPARLVRPWPGLVDMEEMPPAEKTENSEKPATKESDA